MTLHTAGTIQGFFYTNVALATLSTVVVPGYPAFPRNPLLTWRGKLSKEAMSGQLLK